MNLRKPIFFIAILALAVVTILVARFLFSVKEGDKTNLASNQSGNKEASIIEFSRHKSFLSRKYKFVIEYPDNWYIRRNTDIGALKKYSGGHSFCFNDISTRRLENSDSPYCGLDIFITQHPVTPLSAEGRRNAQFFLLNGARAIKGISTDEYTKGAPVVDLQTEDWHYSMTSFEREYTDSDRENLVQSLQSFELTHSSGPAVYKSRIFSAGEFTVVLPKGWVYQENPDDVAIAVFYWEGATALEGVGSKVYLHPTNARSFEDFQKEVKERDVEIQGVTYATGAYGGFETILARGYPGVADESSVLYAFTGNGWYFEFVDPPFDLNSLKKL